MTDISPLVTEQFRLIASLALYLSPVIIALTELLKKAFPETVQGVVTIAVALLVGLLVGLVLTGVGVWVGIFAGVYAVAITGTAKKIGEVTFPVYNGPQDSNVLPPVEK